MSEKPLLLSSAKSGVLVDNSSKRWRYALFAIGLFMVLYGAADATSRMAESLGGNAALLSFGPAITLTNPATRAALYHTIASTTPIVPARLTIPSIGVNAVVESVGKKADGSMGTPSNFDNVAWYALGAKPGAEGSAVIDGHVNNALTKPGVFEHLSQVQLGDTISVTDASSTKLTFVVKDIEEISADQEPPASIFTNQGPSQLVLITCDGDWVPAQKSFNKRLVVFASLVQ